MAVGDKAPVSSSRVTWPRPEQLVQCTDGEERGSVDFADRSEITTPSPLTGQGRKTGTTGVQHRVAARREKVAFALDRLAVEAVTEQVAGPVMSAIRPARKFTVEHVHSRR